MHLQLADNESAFSSLVGLVQKYEGHIPVNSDIKWTHIASEFFALPSTQPYNTMTMLNLRRQYAALAKQMMVRIEAAGCVSQQEEVAVLLMHDQKMKYYNEQCRDGDSLRNYNSFTDCRPKPQKAAKKRPCPGTSNEPAEQQLLRQRSTARDVSLNFSNAMVLDHLLALVRKHEAHMVTAVSKRKKWAAVVEELFQVDEIQQAGYRPVGWRWLWQKYSMLEASVLVSCSKEERVICGHEHEILDMARERAGV